LQPGLGAIRDDLGIAPSAAFEDTEDRRLAARSTPALASHTPRAEVGLVDFNLAAEPALLLADLDDALAQQPQVAVDGVTVQASQLGGLDRIQIEAEQRMNCRNLASEILERCAYLLARSGTGIRVLPGTPN
jgi:hypothetical protein